MYIVEHIRIAGPPPTTSPFLSQTGRVNLLLSILFLFFRFIFFLLLFFSFPRLSLLANLLRPPFFWKERFQVHPPLLPNFFFSYREQFDPTED
ncbi:uncharacterized protein N7487_001030 [Penicillium crustosum]|uniref:uncharacterized protein n=1 Tax=Penicillium crustosum TaxID=36656 RepID=UPI002395CE7B|nr:uncharacterized protein N7487_001030 [Penicillium crustosum]KAJ5417480.1 hypothetical protein N7487_001030 [Penicillium crustosum]